MSTLAEPAPPGVDDDVDPCEHETTHRIITGTVTVVPVLCLHWATNGLGYLAAYLVTRRDRAGWAAATAPPNVDA